ncbi:MAG: sugar phosphate nucleotidyltransferase [Thermoflexibacter sp.]|jgi:glucose-1-phosphate thymidylyltransferase|nr:sugar phosphate nucleotidyltransferase [Thermoflexibacter sp.]
MKVVIPLAGIGSRLRPHTYTQPKALLQVGGKPILGHILDRLLRVGLDDFVFVIGEEGYQIESYISAFYPQIKRIFVAQESLNETAHAIWTARQYIANEAEILIVPGDIIFSLKPQEILWVKHSVAGVHRVDNPGQFNIVELDDDKKYIDKVSVKPKIPMSNLALIGIYKISNVPLLMKAVEHLISNELITHGEYYMTDALKIMLSEGEKVGIAEANYWYDCGKKDSLLAANVVLLNRPEFQSADPEKYRSCILIPPVSIGENCQIEHCIIGPDVAIGNDTKIKDSIIKNSIIGSYSQLQNAVLDTTLIGDDVTLKSPSLKLNLGDHTEMG